MELEDINSAHASETVPLEGRNKEENKKRGSGYPKRIFFIIGNEFCERFSFYGMRTVLVLYARNYLRFDDNSATAVFHAFTVLAYLIPLFGGILADSFLGKYKTIAYLSLIYVAGHAFKTIAAIPYIPDRSVHIGLSMLGLFLIAFGTGGIKPCVSAFGGDQFTKEQTRYRSQFFSMFYFSINAGALLSKWLTPMFRADLRCYPGHDEPEFQECFSVAFGVPGLLMLFALVLFLLGTKYYTYVAVEGSVFWKFCKCIASAVKNRWFSKRHQAMPGRHWIDYASASEKTMEESKAVLKVLYLFMPLPFFWALFDQQGSRWTLQALQLDGYWGSYLVKPDQIDVLNPLLIVTLIPLFEASLYPLLRRYKINFSPLRKMTAGLILAGLSFVCAAILQFQIDQGLTPLPKSNEYSVRVINLSPCSIHLNSSSSVFDGRIIEAKSVTKTKSEFLPANQNLSLSYRNCDNSELISIDVAGQGGKVIDVISGTGNNIMDSLQSTMPVTKFENGSALVSFVNVNYPAKIFVENRDLAITLSTGQRSNLPFSGKGRKDYIVYSVNEKNETSWLVNGSIQTNPGGVYTVMLENNSSTGRFEEVEFSDGLHFLSDVNPNTINIAWMIPQYFIITVGEVFLSITGLEFAYTQAPVTMKSVVTSFWLFTVSVGNFIVLIIAKLQAIERQAYEFLLFAGLIGVAAMVFSIMARGYVLMDERDEVGDRNQQIIGNEETVPLDKSS